MAVFAPKQGYVPFKQPESIVNHSIPNLDLQQNIQLATPAMETMTEAQIPERLLPSEEERKWYYFGLTGLPKLVARSSAATKAWHQRVEDNHPVRKQLSRVGQHPIVNKSQTTSLGKDIVNLLDSSLGAWNCVDVLRIGDHGWFGSYSNPVILWVGVLPGSTSSRLGMAVALQCRAILQRYALDDVHCEIREATVQLAASSAARNNQSIVKNLDVKNVDEITHSGYHFPTFTDTIGQSVAIEANPDREATLSCFVALAKERNAAPEKYAVISRHLAFAHDDTAVFRYHKSSPKKYVIMPGNETLRKAKATAVHVLESWTLRLAQLEHAQSTLSQQQQQQDQQQQAQRIGSVRQYIAKAKAFHDHLVSLTDPETRRIGYVEYSAAYRVDAGTKTLPDFALVKLDQGRFQARLDHLANTVYIADKPDLSGLDAGLAWDVYAFPHNQPGGTPAILSLQGGGAVPAAHLSPPWKECGRETIRGEPVLRVGKRGANTGLTWGEVNDLMSVVREVGDGGGGGSKKEEVVLPSLHLTVLGLDAKPFSAPGDSGSAIFTPDGKMVAMLDAGRGPYKEDLSNSGGVIAHDVTYATPFDWVLGCIRDAGYTTAHFC